MIDKSAHSIEEVSDKQNCAQNVLDGAAVSQICTQHNVFYCLNHAVK